MHIKENEKIILKNDIGETVSIYITKKYPKIGEELISERYKDAVIINIKNINEIIATNLCDIYDFFEIEFEVLDDNNQKNAINYALICVNRPEKEYTYD